MAASCYHLIYVYLAERSVGRLGAVQKLDSVKLGKLYLVSFFQFYARGLEASKYLKLAE